jgi:hypothetical protein
VTEPDQITTPAGAFIALAIAAALWITWAVIIYRGQRRR